MFISILILCGFLLSEILIVPGEYSTIQIAIDTSTAGDTIQVSPNIYYENLIISEKYLTIISLGTSENTIIDGGLQGPVITCENIENDKLLIRGFTIRNGVGENINGSSFGGGILSKRSRLVLEDLIIENFRCNIDEAINL